MDEDKTDDVGAADAAETDGDHQRACGCEHYQRKCLLVAPCCGKAYVCRLCHNDQEAHEIDRFAVVQVECCLCHTRQSVSNTCTNCSVQFGEYFCVECRLYDDVDKGQFHCDLCGMCRVGCRENFFHCLKCDLCLSISLKESHKCVEKVAHANCPVCLENLHTSTQQLLVLKCGHVTHRSCWSDLLKSGNYSCPLCCHSTVDMTDVWQQLDSEVAATQMPDEYRDVTVWILCRDCHKKSQVSFHVVGLKCSHCGSYNTCTDSEPPPPSPPPPPPHTDADDDPASGDAVDS